MAKTSNSVVSADPLTPKAHLPGLPTELRLQIYYLLISSDIKYNTGAIVKDGPWSWKTIKPQKPLRITVGSLAMSCSLLAVEVRTHIRSMPAADRVAAVVYNLEPLNVMPEEASTVSGRRLDQPQSHGQRQHWRSRSRASIWSSFTRTLCIPYCCCHRVRAA